LPEEARERAETVVAALEWKAPWFMVSAIGRDGTREVCLKIQQFFDEQKYLASQDSDDLEGSPQIPGPTA
jgi:GTP-binding protein